MPIPSCAVQHGAGGQLVLLPTAAFSPAESCIFPEFSRLKRPSSFSSFLEVRLMGSLLCLTCPPHPYSKGIHTPAASHCIKKSPCSTQCFCSARAALALLGVRNPPGCDVPGAEGPAGSTTQGALHRGSETCTNSSQHPDVLGGIAVLPSVTFKPNKTH